MLLDYLSYLFSSHNLHGVHSPFVYDLNKNVLNKKVSSREFAKVEAYRNFLSHQNQKLKIEDLGSGSRKLKKKERNVREIFKTSSTNKYFGEIFFTLIKYYRCKAILELGTSLGIGTAYMQCAITNFNDARITTIEGSEALFNYTKSHFAEHFKEHRVNFLNGNFDIVLSEYLKTIDHLDLVFMDGNHSYKATKTYFQLIIPYLHPESIVIIDDINWSEEMKLVWSEIIKHPKVSCSVNLFRWGILFFREGIQKEDFIIRFNGFLKAHIS